jgi:hypothetical protein
MAKLDMDLILFESVGMTGAQNSMFSYRIESVPNKPGLFYAYIWIDNKTQVCSDEFESPSDAIRSLFHKTEEKHGYPHDRD